MMMASVLNGMNIYRKISKLMQKIYIYPRINRYIHVSKIIYTSKRNIDDERKEITDNTISMNNNNMNHSLTEDNSSDIQQQILSDNNDQKVTQNLFLSDSIYTDPIESQSFVKPLEPNEKPFIFINEFTTFELLPIVKIKFYRRITKFYVLDYREIPIDEIATDITGLDEHLLATAPAAEATAAIVAHKLKMKKIERVRIQFDGISQARLPAVKGLFDGGIQIVCLCDVTQTDNIPRPKRPPRV